MQDKVVKKGLGSAKPFFIAVSGKSENVLHMTDDQIGKSNTAYISSEALSEFWPTSVDETSITAAKVGTAGGHVVYVPMTVDQFKGLMALHGYGVYSPSDINNIKDALGKPKGPSS